MWFLVPALLVDTRLHAKRRLNELKELGEERADATAAWADGLVDKLDAAAISASTEAKLLDECAEVTRDLGFIDQLIQEFPTPSVLPKGDFRLVWVRSDDALAQIGTGLHRVPLARMEELFVTLDDTITLTEVIRVIGPFPNVKNQLFGDYSLKKLKMNVSYKTGVDGTGKELKGARDVSFRLVHASNDLFVLEASNGKDQWLVFEREIDINDALKRLRVPPNDDDDES